MTLQARLVELDEYIEFAECRVSAGSAAGGQFTTCGKAFSRMSAHPDQRKKPIPGFSLDLSPEDDAEAEAITGKRGSRAEHVIRSAYEGDLGGGVRSVVTYIKTTIPTTQRERDLGDHNRVDVRGNILNGDGQKVGEFLRTISRDERTLVAKHELLTLHSTFRNQGIADRFNARAVATYEAMGVDRIVLDAAMSHGGYAWARQGFRIYGTQDEDRHQILQRLASGTRFDQHSGKPNGSAITHPELADKQELAALVRASAAGEDVQPIHLASIGETRRGNSDTWFGKELLLGSTWPGVYYLDRGNPVTASAVDLRFADLRPAFRIVDELVTISTDEYACHDASCRPPTSGGTGGSLPMQHVTTSQSAQSILKSGFSLDSPAWNRAFGEGVYFSHAGDTKSSKFYARLGGRTTKDAQIIQANVSLSNPLRISGNTVGAIRMDLVEKLGGPPTIRAQAQAMYDRDVARARKIMEEELKPDNPDAYSKLDHKPEDATFWDFSEAAYGRMANRIGKELETGNLDTLKSLHALTHDDVLHSIATSPLETYNGAYSAALGNIARKLGHDGLIIESDKLGSVGGSQVVVYDLSKIQVTGSGPLK